MTLNEYRKKKNMTMKQMAELLGLKSQASIFNYENGQIPRKAVMDKIERITNNWVKAKDFY